MKIAVHADLAAGEIAAFEAFNVRTDRFSMISQPLRETFGRLAEPVRVFMQHLCNVGRAGHDGITPSAAVLLRDRLRREAVHTGTTCESTMQFSRAPSDLTHSLEHRRHFRRVGRGFIRNQALLVDQTVQ